MCKKFKFQEKTVNNFNFSNIKITGGFWKQKQDLVRDITTKAVYNRFKETGRIDSFNFDSGVKAHFFWDSDVAKWIEGVAYLTKEKREEELEKIVDEIVDYIEKYQDECGYFNIYHMTVEPEKQFKIRDNHELYCLGHLIEAGVAYYEATGKDKLLKLMCKYVDYVEKRFVIDADAGFTTPGHEEIELALVRLYEITGNKKHLDLAKFFVDKRGSESETLTNWAAFMYNQSHAPVIAQKAAEGHAVRAVYLYSAMADLALKYNDEELKNACKAIFDDIVNKKMYITGGIGSSGYGEAFTVPYDLPNLFAYSESCAAIGLVFFAKRMMLIDTDAKYADVIERILYNGFLSSISLSGDEFFYTNPLELLPYMRTKDVSYSVENPHHLPQTRRQKVFECSCCPPNIVRFMPVISELIYTTENDTIYVNQFIESKAQLTLGDKKVTIEQKTAYPYDGKVEITVTGAPCTLAVRIPSYSDKKDNTIKGYKHFQIHNEKILVDFHMKPRFVVANPEVVADADKCALTVGPVVYCMEGVDNEGHLRSLILDTKSEIVQGINETLGVPTLTLDAYQRKPSDKLYSYTAQTYKTKATLIPYFAFANREECEMQVWHNFR